MQSLEHEIEPSRSAYNGMIVAAPFAAMAWILVLGGLFLFT
jgi:hypothetical protein